MKRMLLALAVAVFFMPAACEKNDVPETDRTSMTGSVIVDVPLYMNTGDVVDMSVSGITVPENPKYSWTGSFIGDSDGKFGNDTIVDRTSIKDFTAPSVQGLYSLEVMAVKDGYYTKRAEMEIMVLSSSTSLVEGMLYPVTSFKDERDGTVYYYTTVGDTDWFSMNLRWDGAGVSYDGSDVLGRCTGRLYTWAEATGGISASEKGEGPQGICPEGWSIPTNGDWNGLAAEIGGTDYVFEDVWSGIGEKLMNPDASLCGKKFWPYDPSVDPSDGLKWCALSSGYASGGGKTFSSMFERGFWWSSTEKNEREAYYRILYSGSPDFTFSYTDKDDIMFSVRCVRKHQ